MALTVGVPKETKTASTGSRSTPDGVRELERHGVDVFVQAGAGVDSAIPDAAFERRRRDDRAHRGGRLGPGAGRQGQGAPGGRAQFLRRT